MQSNTHKTVSLNSNIPSEDKNFGETTKLKILLTLPMIKLLWNQMQIELKIHRNPLRILDCFCSEKFTERVQNPSLEMQQKRSEIFPLK